MTTTLITGGNRSLGLETAKRLKAAGHDVWIGARDAAAGEAVAQENGVRFVQLDVTDDASVDAAAKTLEAAGGLDVLVNNAGIPGEFKQVDELTADGVEEVYAVNVFGIVRVTHAFLPLLRRSEAPVIVNVASGLGSHGRTTQPGIVESSFATITYGSSKAAVAMLTTQYAKALPEMRVNVVDPGYTATDFNDHSGHQTVTEGTDAIVAMAQIGDDFANAPTATFTDRDGSVPW